MKRVIVSLGVLALILGVCIAEHLITDSFENKAYLLIDAVKESKKNNDNSAAKNNIDQLKNLFEESETSLSLFTSKEIIDDIERSIYRLSDYNNGDDILFLSELSVLETEMKELKRTSGVFVNSVF